MDKIPKRSKLAFYRKFTTYPLEKYLWLPFKNPDIYSVINLFLSIPFLFLSNKIVLIVLLIISLYVDWLDGATARRYHLVSARGYIVDRVIDRIGDEFIFLPLIGTLIGDIFFLSCLINNLLTFYSIKTGKDSNLTLRFFYLVVLLFQVYGKSSA